jgi:RNA polymerase sigma factor (sigma-70 family)
VEASALTHRGTSGLRGPSPLLRLQSDERLVALTRRGQHAAFETICSRYESRLLSFCRHMLGSREDAEDVLQEVFAAAFNAVLADEREINVRPWLYRIARNRSLNHLRRASAIGVDSMDVHFADHGLSTGDRVIRREGFRQLLGDVQQLPETQRTALLLREIDSLSYDQIAHAMETTVPSVKSLLVRARISLAEAAEARKLSCEEVRLELGEVAEGLVKLSPPARRHTRDCERCRAFKKQLKDNNHALAAMLPVGPLLMFKKLILTKLGGASASGAHAGATVGAGAGATAGAGAAASGGVSVAGGVFTAGAGALATKAVAGLAAAAIVTAGAVAADNNTHHHRLPHASIAAVHPSEPVIVHQQAQPTSPGGRELSNAVAARHLRHQRVAKSAALAAAAAVTATPDAGAAAAPAKPADPKPPAPQITQVTTETTELPPPPTVEVPPTGPTSTGTTGGAEAPPTTAGTEPSPPASPPAAEQPSATPPGTGAGEQDTTQPTLPSDQSDSPTPEAGSTGEAAGSPAGP